MLDLCTSAFVPMNDVRNHLVYAENGSSVRMVVVDGEIVVEDGRCTRIDERAVLVEARERLGAFLRNLELVERDAAELEPYFRAAYERCVREHDAGAVVLR